MQVDLDWKKTRFSATPEGYLRVKVERLSLEVRGDYAATAGVQLTRRASLRVEEMAL